MVPMHLGSRMGTAHGIYPWVSALVMGNLMGRHFWVVCGCSSSGDGWGRESDRPRSSGSVFTGRRALSNGPIYVIYYMLNSGGFTVTYLQAQPVDLFHTLKTVKELLHLVPSRTLRISGYGVLYTCGLCYMLFLLYA
jgi:hypothetical protein